MKRNSFVIKDMQQLHLTAIRAVTRDNMINHFRAINIPGSKDCKTTEEQTREEEELLAIAMVFDLI